MSDKTEFIEVECTYCKTKFNKTLHRYKESQKMGYKPFCSKKCKNEFRITSLRLKCSECSKDITILRNIYLKSKNKKFFCSHSCSAKSSNKIRGAKSPEEKLKIKNSLKYYYLKNGKINKNKEIKAIKVKEKTCVICNKTFRTSKETHICCSRKCGQIYQFGSLPYTKDEVINKIINIHITSNRTPQKADCERKLTGAATRFFGSWNKAMLACGLKPNHSKYQKTRLKCKDGHMADSISEKIIDDWFYENNVKHQRTIKYTDTNYTCDFYLDDFDLWVEYFGLSGGNVEDYEETIIIKKNIMSERKLNFIGIYPNDLYPKNNLDIIFKDITGIII